MRAIVVTDRAAGTAGMTLVERPTPDAARLASLEGASYGDVVVEVHASGFTGNELEWPSTWVDRLGRDRTPSIPAKRGISFPSPLMVRTVSPAACAMASRIKTPGISGMWG